MKHKVMKSYLKHCVCAVLTAAMVLSGIPAFNGTTDAQAAAKQSEEARLEAIGKRTYDNIMKSISEMPEPDLYINSDDPYGYGLDVPFFFNRQDELVLWDSHNKTNSDQLNFEVYDNLKSKNTGSLFSGAKEKILSTTDGNGDAGNLNFVQLKAFDPTNSGRDDYLAVLGVYNYGKHGDNSLYLYVCNKTSKNWA